LPIVRSTTLALLLFVALLVAPAAAHNFEVGSIRVGHPWARATPPVAPVAGGYLKLVNAGLEPDRLLSISSPIAERVEIHESTVVDGVARMRPVAGGVEIGAGATVELKPGGTHIMFIKPNRPLKEGDVVPATLTFERAGTVDVAFAVQGMGAPAGVEHNAHGTGAE